MKVRWQVDDGYVGGRPQSTEIDDDELEEYETEEDKQWFIDQCVQEDFEQKITWCYI